MDLNKSIRGKRIFNEIELKKHIPFSKEIGARVLFINLEYLNFSHFTTKII